jgi:murein DD-endopeptidase MepM/ murein hydrolase activator NlpD
MAIPITGRTVRTYDAENLGIDISAAAGSKIVATEDGVVAAITKDSDRLPILVVRHADNLLTLYARITDLKVAKGDLVKRGQTLGSLAQDKSTYIHFAVYQGFDFIDPMPYLR